MAGADRAAEPGKVVSVTGDSTVVLTAAELETAEEWMVQVDPDADPATRVGVRLSDDDSADTDPGAVVLPGGTFSANRYEGEVQMASLAGDDPVNVYVLAV